MIDVVTSGNNVKVYDTTSPTTPIINEDVSTIDTIVNKVSISPGDELTKDRIYVYSPDLKNVELVYKGDENNHAKIIGTGTNVWSNGKESTLQTIITSYYYDGLDISNIFHVGDKRKVHLNAIPSGEYADESHMEQDINLVIYHIGGKKLETPINGHETCALVVGQEKALNTGEFIDNQLVLERGKLYTTNRLNTLLDNYNTITAGTTYKILRFEPRWSNCDRRSWCNADYYNAYPESLRPLFKRFYNNNTSDRAYTTYSSQRIASTVYSSVGGYGPEYYYVDDYDSPTYDYFIIPSTTEVVGEKMIVWYSTTDPKYIEGNLSQNIGYNYQNENTFRFNTTYRLFFATATDFQFDYFKTLLENQELWRPCNGDTNYSDNGYFLRHMIGYNATYQSNYLNIIGGVFDLPGNKSSGALCSTITNGKISMYSSSYAYRDINDCPYTRESGLLMYGCI